MVSLESLTQEQSLSVKHVTNLFEIPEGKCYTVFVYCSNLRLKATIPHYITADGDEDSGNININTTMYGRTIEELISFDNRVKLLAENITEQLILNHMKNDKESQ